STCCSTRLFHTLPRPDPYLRELRFRRGHQARHLAHQERRSRVGASPITGVSAVVGMTADASPESVASAYFDAWTDNDVEKVRPLLHEDVDFVGALGTTHGVHDTLAGSPAACLMPSAMPKSRTADAGSLEQEKRAPRKATEGRCGKSD